MNEGTEKGKNREIREVGRNRETKETKLKKK